MTNLTRHVAATLALTLLGLGVGIDGRIDAADLRTLGAAGLVILACAFLTGATREHVLEYVRQHGYDDGYEDARSLSD